jgi:hypothetical protein
VIGRPRSERLNTEALINRLSRAHHRLEVP